MKRRPWLPVAAWVATVAVASSLVWAVISRAGAQPGRDPLAVPTLVVTSNIMPATPTASPSASSTASGTPSPQPSPSRSVTSTAQRGTWSGAAGFVTASCTGGVVTIQTVIPAEGWKFKIEDRTGRLGKVEFERGEAKVELAVTCAADGSPSFRQGD